MGLLKITQDQVIMAEGVLQLTAALSSNTLTIDVIYALDMGSSKLAKANIVYTKGGSNSFVLTAMIFFPFSVNKRKKTNICYLHIHQQNCDVRENMM